MPPDQQMTHPQAVSAQISSPYLLPPRPIRVLAAPTPSFLVAGKIDQGAAATEPAAADAAIELPTATSRLADADVTTSRADLDATSDPFVTHASPRSQRDGQGDRLLDEVVARASCSSGQPQDAPLTPEATPAPAAEMDDGRSARHPTGSSPIGDFVAPEEAEVVRRQTQLSQGQGEGDLVGPQRTGQARASLSGRAAPSNEWPAPRASPSGGHGSGRRSVRGGRETPSWPGPNVALSVACYCPACPTVSGSQPAWNHATLQFVGCAQPAEVAVTSEVLDCAKSAWGRHTCCSSHSNSQGR